MSNNVYLQLLGSDSSDEALELKCYNFREGWLFRMRTNLLLWGWIDTGTGLELENDNYIVIKGD